MELFKLSRPQLFVASLHGTCRGDEDAARLMALLRDADQQRAREVWLLCQQLEDMDYRCLQALLQVLNQLSLAHTALIFCGLPPAIQAKFEATGLAGIVTLVASSAYTGPRPLLR
jgi:anti-anti-sigma regulatory factor